MSFVQKSKAGRSTLLLIIAANFVILIVGTYLFSLNYPGWDHIPDSARRMAMFFSPLFIFYIGSTDIFARIANMMFFRKR